MRMGQNKPGVCWSADKIERGNAGEKRVYHQMLQLDENQRIILISDIHGCRSLFHELLAKCQFNDQDVLILLGDLGEKGPDSLGVLHDVMELCAAGNTYVVQGNCDCLVPSLMKQELADFIGYTQFREASLLNEMAHVCGYAAIDETNAKACRQAIAKRFAKELAFIDNMPLILESESMLFVHAGLRYEEISRNTWEDFLTLPAFMEGHTAFKKHVYCGHWPTLNYHMDIADCRPYTNAAMNVTGIDGGNGVKDEGQLNALILDQGKAYSVWVDSLPAARICKAQAANPDPIFISWAKREVLLLQRQADQCYCEHLASKRKLWLSAAYLYEDEGKLCCYDYTDYRLNVLPGDIVKVITKHDGFVYAKHNGLVGWIAEECF